MLWRRQLRVGADSGFNRQARWAGASCDQEKRAYDRSSGPRMGWVRTKHARLYPQAANSFILRAAAAAFALFPDSLIFGRVKADPEDLAGVGIHGFEPPARRVHDALAASRNVAGEKED